MATFYANDEVFPLQEILIQEKSNIISFQEESLKRILVFIQNFISKDDLVIDEILVDEISYFSNREKFNNQKLTSIGRIDFFFFNGSNYRSEFIWQVFIQTQKIYNSIDIDFLKKNNSFLKKKIQEIKVQLNDLNFFNEDFKKDYNRILAETNLVLLEENSIIKVNKIKDKIITLQENLKKNFDRCILRQFNLSLINDENFFKKYHKQELKQIFNLMFSKIELAIKNFQKSQYNQALYLLQDILEGLQWCNSFIERALNKKIFEEFLKIEKKIIPFIQKVIYNLENSLLKRNYFLIEQILEKEGKAIFLLMEKLLQEKF